MRYVVVFGKTPKLSQAELEHLLSVWGIGFKLVGQADFVYIYDLEADPGNLWSRLGGTIKVIGVTPREDKPPLPEGKISFGVSIYGGGNAREKRDIEIQIKDKLRSLGRNSRFVRSDGLAISSGTVTREKLLEKGFEWVRCHAGKEIYEGNTVWVQPIEEFAARDQARPVRDAKVGMLPPKLARIMVNLAATSKPETASGPIYDPFCGTGTILQEALLLGYEAAGSDLEPRMVEASITNLKWLRELKNGLGAPLEVVARAADVSPGSQLEAVATEGYLGPPISRVPSLEAIRMLGKELDRLYKGFWKAYEPALGPGKRVVVCLPIFIRDGQPIRLNNVDSFGNPSYNLEGSYDYYRDGQVVGRQIMVFVHK